MIITISREYGAGGQEDLQRVRRPQTQADIVNEYHGVEDSPDARERRAERVLRLRFRGHIADDERTAAYVNAVDHARGDEHRIGQPRRQGRGGAAAFAPVLFCFFTYHLHDAEYADREDDRSEDIPRQPLSAREVTLDEEAPRDARQHYEGYFKEFLFVEVLAVQEQDDDAGEQAQRVEYRLCRRETDERHGYGHRENGTGEAGHALYDIGKENDGEKQNRADRIGQKYRLLSNKIAIY